MHTAFSYKEYQELVTEGITVAHLHLDLAHEYDYSTFLQLPQLSILGSDASFKLPSWLKAMPNLNALEINMHLTELPDWFVELSTVTHLTLQAYDLEPFPDVLLNMHQLESLHLYLPDLQNFPPKLQLQNLTQLTLEDCADVEFRLLLDSMAHLPKLATYKLPQNMSLKYSYGKANPDVYYFDKFLAKLCKNRHKLLDKGIGQEAVLVLPYLHKKREAYLAQIHPNLFYELLNSPVMEYRQLALDYLNQQTREPIALMDKKVAILGKLTIKHKERITWLEETGAVAQKKIEPDTNYVLLGVSVGINQWKTIVESQLPIILEQDVWNAKEEGYLQDTSDPVMSDNLSSLLLHEDESNISIALEMMENGGVPTNLEEVLVGVMLFQPNGKIRKKAKTIFDRHINHPLPNLTQNLLERQAYRLKDDKKVTTYLRDLVKETHWNLEQLALTVYQVSKKEQAQGLCLMLPNASKTIIDDYINHRGILTLQPHTRLDKGLYLETLPACIEIFCQREQSALDFKPTYKIADDEFLRLKGLKEFRIDLQYTRKIPDSIFEITSLHTLELVAYRATKLSPNIGQLTQLVKLDLTLPYIKKLPKELHNITQLKHSTLYLPDHFEFPDFILQQKQLEQLWVSNPVNSLPSSIEDLKHLKYLHVESNEQWSEEDKKRLQAIQDALD